MTILKIGTIGLSLGALLTVAACGTLGGGPKYPLQPGEVGSATPGHLRDSGNYPVRDAEKECINLGYSVGPDHPKAPPGDCTVQPPPPPPPPAPVAEPAPPPPPPPAPKPVKQKITLQADALFDFDKATLKPGGKASIDEALATKAKENITIETILATGHTDSIGTDAYNDKLSLRRAQAVKDYMVSQGVDASHITVEGKGKRQPVASNKTKEGRAKNRRVEIEFNGFDTVIVK